MHHLFFFILFTFTAYAQHSDQPQKENTQDLRTNTVLFIITDEDSGKNYVLERNAGLDHFLLLKDEDEIEVVKKTDTRDAKKIDQDFAAIFLRIQYELPATSGDCRVKWRLFMKGETQVVCNKEDKKSQEVEAFVGLLKKRF